MTHVQGAKASAAAAAATALMWRAAAAPIRRGYVKLERAQFSKEKK